MKTRGGMEVTGFEEFRRRLRQELANHSQRAGKAISEIGDVALKEAVDRAPVDEGQLAASIEKILAEENGALVAVIRVPLNAPAADYAVAMHEDDYTPGPKSQNKGSRLGKEVGRKYITRGIEAGRERFAVIIKKNLEV